MSTELMTFMHWSDVPTADTKGHDILLGHLLNFMYVTCAMHPVRNQL